MEKNDPVPTLLCGRCKHYMLEMTNETRHEFNHACNKYFEQINFEAERMNTDCRTNDKNAIFLRMRVFGKTVVKGEIESRFDIPDQLLTIEGWAIYTTQNPSQTQFVIPSCEFNSVTNSVAWTDSTLTRFKERGHVGATMEELKDRLIFAGCSACPSRRLIDTMITCEKCKQSHYCSKACSKADLRTHNAQCVPYCRYYKSTSSD